MPIQYEARFRDANMANGWAARRQAWKDAQRPAIAAQVRALGNQELLDEYTDFAGGDDWEGERTCGGEIVWQELRNELNIRLVTVGFLLPMSGEDD